MNLIACSWQVILPTCLKRADEDARTCYHSRIDGYLLPVA